MQVGQILELTIDDIGMTGEGIAHCDAFPVFVPCAMVNERVRVEVTSVKKGAAYAKIIKMLEASSDRIAAICPVFGKCGGCTMQHLSRESELAVKVRNVVNCFRKNARLSIDTPDIITAPNRFGYRNKIALPFKEIRGKVALGMYKPDSHKLVPITECPLSDGFEKILIDVFTRFANSYKVSAYDEKSGDGVLRHLVARKLKDVISIVVVVNTSLLPHTKELIEMLKKELSAFSLSICVNKKRNNVILGDTLTPIYGDALLRVDVNGIQCEVHPFSFLQVNDRVRDLAYERILAEIEEGSTVVDAYSGIGIMTAQIAKKAAKVYGVEISREAVENADRIAKINELSGKIEHILGDAKTKLPEILSAIKTPTTVVLDPPRQGIAPDIVPALFSPKVNKIIYLSCNPATLSRDVALLSEHYLLSACCLFDMFPLTGNVETLAVLSRKN